MWIYETLYPDIKVGLKGNLIYKKKSRFQDLRIYKTERFGNVLVLDGAIQTTQKDEFIYHEMMSHTLMLLHPKPERILIIGGGDGGILREVLKYKSVKKAYLVEIDRQVIELTKKYLKSICKNSFSDKRTKIVLDDGAKFLHETDKKFDIVIVDSPDPVGVAKTLFSKKFYKDINSVLTDNGFMIRQTGSTILQPHGLKDNCKILKTIFPHVWPHMTAIPTYIGGFFSLTAAGKATDISDVSIDILEKRYKKNKLKTQYYNPYLHIGSVLLPEYVNRSIR
jgi:spermidine synthase